MSDKPFAISEIADPEQIRIVLYNGERLAHAPLNSILKLAPSAGGQMSGGGSQGGGCGDKQVITLSFPAGGIGDMLSSIYDPKCVQKDAFDMDSMVEGQQHLILKTSEREAIGKVEGLEKKSQDHADDLVSLKGALHTTSGKVDANTAKITTVDGKVDANAAKITTLEGKVDEHTVKLTELDDKIKDNANKDAELEKRVKTLEDEPKIPIEFVEKVNTLEGDVTGLKAKDVELQAGIDGIESCCNESRELVGKAEAAATESARQATLSGTSAEEAKQSASEAAASSKVAVEKSDTAVKKSDTAINTANSADAKSDQAIGTSNTAKDTSEEALRISREAKSESTEAKNVSSEAREDSKSARSNSESAVNTSEEAKRVVLEAKATSEKAEANSKTAVETANSATATANAADKKSDQAIKTSDEALATAKESDYKADHAQGESSAAKDVADKAMEFSESAEKCCREVRDLSVKIEQHSKDTAASAKVASDSVEEIKQAAKVCEESVTTSEKHAEEAKTSSVKAKEVSDEAIRIAKERQFQAISASIASSPFLVKKKPYTLIIRKFTSIPITHNDKILVYETDSDVEISTAKFKAAGRDLYVYLVVDEQNNNDLKIEVSPNSTFPTGYTAQNSRKIGGFHTLCMSVGKIAGHPLSGLAAGDVLPASVWCLNHRPYCSPEGMVYDDKTNVWVDIYLMSDVGGVGQSKYNVAIFNGKTYDDYGDRLIAAKKSFLTELEFTSMANGSNEKESISAAPAQTTSGGHIATSKKRMISNIGCEDCVGYIWQVLDEVTSYTYVQFGVTYVQFKFVVAGGDSTSKATASRWLRNGVVDRTTANTKICTRGKSEPAPYYEIAYRSLISEAAFESRLKAMQEEIDRLKAS